MKNVCLQTTAKAFLALLMVLAVSTASFAQKITVSGTVYEPEGEPAIGASVEVLGGTGFGVATDVDGNYKIEVDSKGTLVFSYVGCDKQEIPVNGRQVIDVKLKQNTVAMSELVVIGYGTVKKSDATGSVGVVKPGEIEAGLASTAQDLLVGASPGVVVSTNGGDPAGGASIQIRGGASLSASNDPLIVVDGVPMEGGSVKGSSNPLSLINPENIENMTILKSASATAIYGSRASNGVIIITTKTGKAGKPQVSFAANFKVETPRNYLDMMSASRFRDFIISRYGADTPQAAALGEANTNWQKEVLRTTFSHDYSLSVGGTAAFLPYRVSVDYSNQQGIVRRTSNDRLGASINLTPKFFDDLLSVNVNLKGSYIRNHYDQGSLGGAIAFNPTLPVHSPNVFNNWTTYIANGAIAGPTTPGTEINTLMAINPVSMIYDYNSKSNVYQSVGNLQLDLKMPFLRELRANLNIGYDYSHGEVTNLNAAGSPLAWKNGFGFKTADFPDYPNPDGVESINLKNGYTTQGKEFGENYTLLLDFYLNYNKTFREIKSDLDVTAGYSWQRFNFSTHNYNRVDPAIAQATDESIRQFADYQYSDTYYWKSRYQLLSFFGRVNYTFNDRYLLTATLRFDGTSRFGKDHRWGTFPAVALGWKIIEESFMEDARSWMNDLKIRAEYGVTGQQNIAESYFPYLPIYSVLTGENNTYPINGNYVQIAYPNKYNGDIKWEETHTWNVGIDFGFMNNRINGSLDWYRRKSKDLLVYANYPAGSNLSNTGNINLGDLTNTGIEFNINTRPVVTNEFTWNSNLNIAWNKNKITRLADGADTSTGGIGNGVNVQKHIVGEAANTFYVYEQVYDQNGNPLEGVYVDQNADGVINEDDKILYHHIHPDVTLTWINTFNYKNWDFGITLRGAFGNWAYNQNMMGNSFISATATAPLSNVLDNTYLFETTRNTELMLSNHWVQNASFIRCDNITVGYTWDKLLKDRLRLRLFGAVQNPFVITKYKGLDPELVYNGGIDNSVYPRPVSFTLGVVASF
ncbi:MAG: TonB-dependent receptor [Muribaculaceae bacterium]|nr:TonB-dependent receptor [Muribaculaceae bacterium]